MVRAYDDDEWKPVLIITIPLINISHAVFLFWSLYLRHPNFSSKVHVESQNTTAYVYQLQLL
jgi:hypothetical protein